MAGWTTVTAQDVRNRYPELNSQVIPEDETLYSNKLDAENYLRPFLEVKWPSGAESNGTVKMLVVHVAAAFAYRSEWGMRAFGNTAAAQASEAIFAWVDKYLDRLLSGETTLAGVTAAEPGADDFDDSDPIFDLGRDLIEPSGTNEDGSQRRF